MRQKINIALAEDHALLRESLMATLRRHPGINVLFGAGNGLELLGLLKTARPDIVLLDLEMPLMNGHEALKQIRLAYPHIKVAMLSGYFTGAHIVECIGSGACAFLSKSSNLAEFIKAIHTLQAQGYYYSHEVSNALARQAGSTVPRLKLTAREAEITRLLCRNRSNNEIAAALHISLRTVEGHRYNVMQKTGAKNLAALITYAIEQHLITK